MLQFILERLLDSTLFYFDEDQGGGDGGDPNGSGTDGDGKEKKPFKTFATEEEYNNELKSTASKAKNELLNKIGVKSVDEATTKIAKGKESDEIATKYVELQEEVIVTRLGIREEYKSEALALAKLNVKDDVTLEEALTGVVKKLPVMADPKRQVKLGTEKTKEQQDDEVKNGIKKKYPWIK